MTAPAAVEGRWPTEPCRSCRQLVIWTVTERANSMPVDAEPSPQGTFALDDREGRQPLARVVRPDLRFGRTDLRTSHFATCPHAQQWRRKATKRADRVSERAS